MVFVIYARQVVFYYYGRKKQIAKRYPAPEFATIIEPFAGAASYSLHGDNWRRDVILVEKDSRVIEIWRWLVEQAKPRDILALPDLKVGERSSEFLHIVHAATKMAFKYKTIKVTPVLERNWEISKRVMAANVHKVKHWKIISNDYTAAPDIEATWFIDPPYKSHSGTGYAHGSDNLDYGELATWALTRKGQIICCEGNEGDYLPFSPLLQLTGVAGKMSKEVVYHRFNGVAKQPNMFFH
jgi:16S rRNA G966 N2-methylase RsmD